MFIMFVSHVKYVLSLLLIYLHVNEVFALSCYGNILINKLLTGCVYICFVNKKRH